ncbi:copper chaperone PCu(A)C [Luteimonas sp. R10]|uniref:copper chaperone PCu(A)C n=1 Tax=Luteimonas sp. R10 TaxID=3108176 RepID=UPI00308E7F9B|nr:copper chaperone PCu(A)C [Luteimonas sp. R10]
MKIPATGLAALLMAFAGCSQPSGTDAPGDDTAGTMGDDATRAAQALPPGVAASDAWVREVPAGGRVAGGYLTIANGGDSDDRLLAVESDQAARVEIHEMRHEDGMMRMRHLDDGLPLPAGERTALAPGGYHLMFIEPVRPFAAGDEVPATLRFAHAPAQQVVFEVRGPGGEER